MKKTYNKDYYFGMYCLWFGMIIVGFLLLLLEGAFVAFGLIDIILSSIGLISTYSSSNKEYDAILEAEKLEKVAKVEKEDKPIDTSYIINCPNCGAPVKVEEGMKMYCEYCKSILKN